MLHIPRDDRFVDKDTQKTMHAGLDDHPKELCTTTPASTTALLPNSASAAMKKAAAAGRQTDGRILWANTSRDTVR